MVIDFPQILEDEIFKLSKVVPTSQLMSQAALLSKHYRESMISGNKPLVQGDLAALSYSVIIMPATYAQLTGAIIATKLRIPNWQPTSLLDLGSGPGTALWAAQAQWPSLEAMTAVEKESAFLKLGQRLANVSDNSAIRNTIWRQANLKSAPRDNDVYDLVIIGHALNEMSEDLQRFVVDYAWQHCKGVLLIVEPGTSAAFPIVRAMRDYLLKLGAKTIAPCTHDKACPLQNDWCHFPQRINRPAFQRKAKAGTAGWEESKFSYAAMARFEPDSPAWGRLIHQPNVQKGLVELTVSTQGRIIQPKVLKRLDRAKFNEVSDYKWGEIIVEEVI